MQDETTLAGCLLLDDYGRLLLLHRYAGAGQWELPGGKVEADESPEEAAVREIQEELGVAVTLTQSLGNEVFEEADNTYRYYWYVARIEGGEPKVVERDRFDDLDYFEIEDLPSLALSANMQILHDKLLSGEVVIQS